MTDEDTGDGMALRALGDLISEGGWHPTDSGPAMRAYLRPWPDNSVDNLIFTDAHHASAERVNHNGEPVWQLVGTLTEVVAELGALPAPNAPDAPHTVLSRRDATDRDM
jgi:hypothetical protein